MILDEALAVCPVVAILRGVRPDEVLEVTQRLYAEGLRAVEVPLNSPEPFESIRRLCDAFGERMACGAGTVLSPEMVDLAADAGARIIIAPNTDPLVIGRAVALGLEPAPGFASPSEAFLALASGARHLKLFPAATYGPGHIRQLKAVLPARAVVWAVGGVGASRLAEFWEAGVRAFGIGSEIYRPGQTPQTTAERARELAAAAQALPR